MDGTCPYIVATLPCVIQLSGFHSTGDRLPLYIYIHVSFNNQFYIIYYSIHAYIPFIGVMNITIYDCMRQSVNLSHYTSHYR